MDVQATDERVMVLRYVTSYVSKTQDSQLKDEMFSTYVTPNLAAYRHILSPCPTMPEMVLQLSSTTLAWTSLTTKRLVPPTEEKFAEDKIVSQYCRRSHDLL